MMTRKIILTSVIIVGGILAVLVFNFYYGLKKMYRYEFIYNEYGIVFDGKYVDRQMEHDKVIINLDEDNLEKIPDVQIRGQKYRLYDISCEDLKQIGAKCGDRVIAGSDVARKHEN